MKRIFSLFLVFCMIFSFVPFSYAANVEQKWKIEIKSIKLVDELHTTTPEIAYDGTISNINYDNYPSDGHIFAIIGIQATKNNLSADALDITNLSLNIEGKNYNQIDDYSFLDNHGYNSLYKYNGFLQSDTQGYVCFEIPEKFLKDNGKGWIISTEEYQSDGYVLNDSKELPVQPSLTERQQRIEQTLIQQFNAQTDKSINNALVSLNPYEISPLTALIIFDTQQASTVSVTVCGKTSETDISYTIDRAKTHHEVPVFGMYGGYNNKVIVETSTGESREFTIKTAELPKDLPTYKAKVTEQSSFDNNGLMYVVGVPHRHCIDINGDIRWYSTLKDAAGMPEETNPDGTYWTIVPGGSLGTVITKLNFMGKVLSSYSYYNFNGHHDIDIIDNNVMLWLNGNSIMSTNLETGELKEYLALNSILDPNKGYLDYRNASQDWAHQNTIEYSDGKLYLSLRNQCMLIKMDYATKKIEWIATPGLTYDEKGNVTGALQESISDYIVLPESNDKDFEWFWSQHDISIMSDQDNNPNTDDFTLFDNGVYRGDPNTPESEMYSRLVQYRVDTQNRTITQIFEYEDKENGLYSHHMSGTQALNDGQFGCFGAVLNKNTNKYDTKLLEVNSNGKLVGSWVGNGYEAYRAYYYPINTFTTQNIDLSNSESAFEYYKTTSWADYNKQLPISDGLQYEIKTLSVSENNILDITGWAVIDEYSGNFAVPYFVVNGKNTGTKFILLQHTYNEISIPSEFINSGDYSSGFWGVGVDLSLLPDDEYTLGLLVNANGTDQWRYVDLDYTYTKGSKAVTQDDILKQQAEKNQELLTTLNEGSYTINKPLVAVNPYGNSPLSAIVSFKTSKPASITVEVESNNNAKPVKNTFETVTTEHKIPIYGLYENQAVNVKLTANYQDGTSQTSKISITGNSLPSDFVPVSVEKADTTQMVDGWTFIMAGSLQGYTYAIDETGAVRWILSEKGLGAAGSLLPLSNGNYLIGGDKSFGQYYKYNLFELNMTGQIINEYLVNGYHHDAKELPNGNLLIFANNINGDVVEDTMYEIERSTGAILRTWDLNSYFNVENYNHARQHISDVNYGSDTHDWLHTNGMEYDKNTNSVLISARHQDAVFSISLETGEINWILSNPDDLWPEYLEEKLLTPTGDDFEWQYGQHNISLLPNGDIMMFDNGDYRSKNTDGVLPATEGYSRAVIYRIDEENMKVSQVWQFGKELGSASMAAYVSSSQYLGGNHYLIDFGGIVKDSNGNATYNIMDGIQGSSQSQIYEVKDGKIIFHASVERTGLHGNTYRAARMMPYSSTAELDLTNTGNRLGSLYRYGLAETVKFDSSIAVSGAPEVEVSDNGVQLQITSNLGNTSIKSDLAIIFTNDESAYKVALPSDTKIAYTLNNSEIPTGTYKLYLVKDNITYDLKLEWTNSSNYCAFPTAYNIVVKSNISDDLVYGSGIYYPNTSFTVSAVTNDGYKFEGWYIGDNLVSNDANYTTTATSDMTITAKFSGYTDVKKTNWYYDAVNYVNNNGIMTGYSDTKFAPNDKLSRAQACQVIYNIADADEQATEAIFSDVSLGQWYTNAISWASKNGVVSGYGNNLFGPDDSITREQMAAILYRYAGAPSVETNNLGNYTDANQISDWATDALNWCVENKIMVGNGNGTMTPNKIISRAEVATIMMNYFTNIK